MNINPYLNFQGNTEEAFNFYKQVFGVEFAGLMRMKDMPEKEKLSSDEHDKVMHVALPIGQSVLMATDALESMGQKVVQGNNFYLTLSVDSKEQADELFRKLSEGGKIEMPMDKAFWGAYFGSLKDKYGVQWMISYDMKGS